MYIKKCKICGNKKRGIQNAWPIKKGLCCNECFFTYVVPERRDIKLNQLLK